MIIVVVNRLHKNSKARREHKAVHTLGELKNMYLTPKYVDVWYVTNSLSLCFSLQKNHVAGFGEIWGGSLEESHYFYLEFGKNGFGPPESECQASGYL